MQEKPLIGDWPMTPTVAEGRTFPSIDARRLSAAGWLWLHLKIGLFGFGHGAIMPLYQRALVRDTATLAPEAFQEALGASLLLPGPSLITLSMYLGKELYGLAVAVLAVLAMCVPGALWALLIMHAVPIHHPAVRALLSGFSVGALVLLVDMVRQLGRGLSADGPRARAKTVGRACLALVLALLLFAHVPMTLVAVAGVVACLTLEFAL